MVKDTKLYDTLEISPTATEQEINKAYYKLSKIWHPDKNAHRLEEATKKFQEINEAKNILTDSEKREMYDKFGTTQDQPGPGFDPSDLFSQMFNMGGMNMPGMPGMNMPGMGRNKRREDCMVEQVVSLDDLYNNKTLNIKYKHKVYCSKCNETGSKDGKPSECGGCGGQGQRVKVIRQGPMVQQMVIPCDECNGSGENTKNNKDNRCPECNGNKCLVKETSFDFTLNKNMTHNQKILVNDKGHHFKNSKTNLIILIKEQPHPIFKRQGNDLHMNIKLRLFQSVYGFTKTITHLDGRNILIKYDKMLRNMKTIFKVKNEGFNNGHLYIHIVTCMPKIDKLDEQENIILKKLLVKAHLAEYQKEQAINKTSDKLEKPSIEEIDETDDEEDNDNNHHHDDSGSQGPQGVQCVQQ